MQPWCPTWCVVSLFPVDKQTSGEHHHTFYLTLTAINCSHVILSLMTLFFFPFFSHPSSSPFYYSLILTTIFLCLTSLSLLFLCPIRTIDNKIYVAEIKEKHQAKKMYEKAYQQGKTAAHVGVR